MEGFGNLVEIVEYISESVSHSRFRGPGGTRRG